MKHVNQVLNGLNLIVNQKNISSPWMAAWLQKTNHSVWLECSLGAEISRRKTENYINMNMF